MRISSRPAPSPSRSSFPLPPEFPFPVVLSLLFLFLLWPLKAPALQETRERSTAWEPRWRTRTGQNQPRHPSLPNSFSFSHTRALPSFSCCVVFAALQTKRKGEERGGPHGQTHTHAHTHSLTHTFHVLFFVSLSAAWVFMPLHPATMRATQTTTKTKGKEGSPRKRSGRWWCGEEEGAGGL